MITIFVLLNKGGSRRMMVLKRPGCFASAHKDSVAPKECSRRSRYCLRGILSQFCYSGR